MGKQATRPCPRCGQHRAAIIAMGFDPYCSFCGGTGEVDTRSAWEQISDGTRVYVMLEEIVQLLDQGRRVPLEILELAHDALARFGKASH